MAMKSDITSNSNGVTIVGNIDDMQIVKESSDGVNSKVNHNKDSWTLNNFPSNIVQDCGATVYENVAVTNSENVQFGNNTYFHGPVTIKQIIQSKSGVDNASYTRTDDEGVDPHQNPGSKLGETFSKKKQLLIWHKITFSAVCITVVGCVIAVVLVIQNKSEQKTNSHSPDYNVQDAVTRLVVGVCHENFQVIIMSVILLPLTFLLVFYSLLTNKSSKNLNITVKNNHHFNCFDKNCMFCKKKADPLLISPDHLRIVSRTDWLAQPLEGDVGVLRQPVPWVIITHTATESCHSQSECVLRVRLIQMFHIESRKWSDIGYNFLVGGDGSVYYGRGWNTEGAHTKGYNKYSIGIAFIGTFNADPPSKQQVEACEKLLRLGVKLGKLAKDYKLFAHRQLMSTLSPGDKVYDIIKEWPHFVHNVTDASVLIPKY